MTRESWRDTAARIVAALEAFVVSSDSPLKIGEILHAGSILTYGCAERCADQPFIVIDEATREHWVRQCDFLGGKAAPPWRKQYFYFVQTD